ncbi:hypothetical protein E3E12_08765 (plasmid) [Formicincola oecophyllae]|uniref:Right-handed parallel beta-helix repeat-containing protein n=1 Tax=Formicincola oecophyllae TaxID=2558361 RepID=A0A5B9M4B6_9PROT|nr:hypothetical protein [Formicincola oecophyllae]QEF95971.1 hypothetical protein E3E12_08765 [Formicincola oecophyllae]
MFLLIQGRLLSPSRANGVFLSSLSSQKTEKYNKSYTVYNCDGMHDDTEALNNLLQYSHDIHISNRSGICHIKHTIHIINNDTSIKGDDSSSTKIEISSPSEPIIEVKEGLKNFSIKGISISRSTFVKDSQVCGLRIGNNQIFADLDDIISSGSGNGFCLGSIAFGRLNNAISTGNYGNGFFITNKDSTQPAQWSITNSLSQTNDNYGFYVESGNNPLILLPWINIETFANGHGGVRMTGNPYGGYIVSATIEAGVFSSDGGDEISLDTYAGYVKIGSGTFIEEAGQHPTGRNFHFLPSHKGHGIVATTNVADIQIVDTLISHNSEEGIMNGSYHTLLSASTLYGNGVTNENLCGYYGENIELGNSTIISATRSGNLNANLLSGHQGGGLCFATGEGVSISGSDVTFNRKNNIYFDHNPNQAKIMNVIGYNNISEGELKISPGEQSIIIYHHLTTKPRFINLTPLTEINGGWYIDKVTTLSFRVNLDKVDNKIIHMLWQASL